MIRLIAISFIPGVMLGIEIAQGFIVIDLFIIRICIDMEGTKATLEK